MPHEFCLNIAFVQGLHCNACLQEPNKLKYFVSLPHTATANQALNPTAIERQVRNIESQWQSLCKPHLDVRLLSTELLKEGQTLVLTFDAPLGVRSSGR